MSPEVQGERVTPLSVAACYAAYMLTAAFGEWMAVIPGITITMWPPNGVILAFLILHRRSSWPWWLGIGVAGELTGNLIWFHNPLLPTLGYIGANLAEVLAGAWLIERANGGPLRAFQRVAQVMAFLGFGVLLAPAIGAAIGSAVHAAIGKYPFTISWPLWWLGDATGILVATPLIVSAVRAWRDRTLPTQPQVLELLAVAAAMVGLSTWFHVSNLAYSFVLLIPILWAAVRFEVLGAAVALTLIVIGLGLSAQQLSRHPVALDLAAYQHSMLQLFVLVAAATGLLVAVAVLQQREALAELADTNVRLEQRVAERTAEIVTAEKRFKATFENAAVGMCLLDADGTITRVNDSAAELLGRSADELRGQALQDITHTDDRDEMQRGWAALRNGETDSVEFEKRYLRPDGDIVWGRTSTSCVRTPDGSVDYLIKVIQDITASKRANDARQLLMHEVNHRSKNLLAIIQAVARQTAAQTPEMFLDNFDARLQALAASQDLLIKSGWEPVEIRDLVRAQLAHFGTTLDERFDIEGPRTELSVRVAQAIGMALHELATNAVKYGSLSNDSGRVAIHWSLAGDQFTMTWRESGGPPVIQPGPQGFGSTVIDAMVNATLDGEVAIDFAPSGLSWRLTCSTASLLI